MSVERMMAVAEAKEMLTGPVPTVRTPFTKNGEIDYPSLKKCVDRMVESRAKVIVLTAGDSHLIALSDREIEELTRKTCEFIDGRTAFVVADRFYDTKQSVAFAKFAKELGADMFMVLPPDWAKTNTPESLSWHYAEVSKHIPVMIVTNLFIPHGADFGLETIKKALEKSDNILSVKDDMCNDFARKLCLQFGERTAIWAGGQKQNHMNMYPYGCDGYLSTFMNFMPEVAWSYWNSTRKHDMDTASRIIRDIDMPYFKLISSCRGGFDSGVHATLEHFGLGERWRPRPYPAASDEDMERISEFFTALSRSTSPKSTL